MKQAYTLKVHCKIPASSATRLTTTSADRRWLLSVIRAMGIMTAPMVVNGTIQSISPLIPMLPNLEVLERVELHFGPPTRRA